MMGLRAIIIDLAFIAVIVFCLWKAYDTFTSNQYHVIRGFTSPQPQAGAYWTMTLDLTTDGLLAARNPVTISATLSPDRSVTEPSNLYLFFPDGIDPIIYENNGIIKMANITLTRDNTDGKYKGEVTLFYQDSGDKEVVFSSNPNPIIDKSPGSAVLYVASEESKRQSDVNTSTIAFAWIATGLAIAASYNFVTDVGKNLRNLSRKKDSESNGKTDSTKDKPEPKK